MSPKKYCIMDIGGTKILNILVDEYRNVVFSEKIATKADRGKKFFLEQLDNAIISISGKLEKNEKIESIGLCIAAFINQQENTIYSAPNLPLKKHFPLPELLKKKWNIPVLMENDANAAILGEVFYGAAQGCSNALYVTISTGIGGGLFLDGKLYRGREGFAGEIGHIKIAGNRNICGCGKIGCLESAASGTAIGLTGKRIYKDDSVNTEDIFIAAGNGEERALDIINKAIYDIGITLSNINSLLNLECIVIGGGVSKAGGFLFTEIERIIEENASIPGMKKVKVVKAALEPEAGVWGIFHLLNTGPGGVLCGLS